MLKDGSGRRHYFGLDLLRFGLAIYLVLFHTIDNPRWGLPEEVGAVFSFGYFATGTFMVLSGFLLRNFFSLFSMC